eukprot:1673981-Ditylum_brightwellii.AAC.1
MRPMLGWLPLEALRSDNAKTQTGISFTEILCKYNSKSEHTEPCHPQQNPAERRIQDVKRTSAKILDRTVDNKQVLTRSLVRPVDDKEPNLRTNNSGEALDMAVAEFEGSQPETQSELNLLSELVKSPIPTVDSSEINGFDIREHISLEFIRKDQCEAPTKATVIEVDDETGKITSKYIHGGLELVEPNVIQETLLSKEAKDEADGLWIFSKVLNHHIEDKGKIEVEILWDNGETS